MNRYVGDAYNMGHTGIELTDFQRVIGDGNVVPVRQFVNDFDDRHIQIVDQVNVMFTGQVVFDFVVLFIAHRITSFAARPGQLITNH